MLTQPSPDSEKQATHSDLQALYPENQQPSWLGFYLIATSVFVADQLSKLYAVLFLTSVQLEKDHSLGHKFFSFLWQKHPYPTRIRSFVDGFFDLRYVENPGAAWGFLSRSAQSFRTPLFLLISVVSMVFVLLYYRRTLHHQKLVRWALALVFGGALGNFCDRSRLSYVIDFIDWHIYEVFHWPTFNVADAAITVGAILLLIDMLRVHPYRTDAAKEP